MVRTGLVSASVAYIRLETLISENRTLLAAALARRVLQAPGSVRYTAHVRGQNTQHSQKQENHPRSL